MAVKLCKYCRAKAKIDMERCPSCGATDFWYKCANCGTIHESAFCPKCGIKAGEQPKTCPKCGKQYFSASCPDCGWNPVREDTAYRYQPVVPNYMYEVPVPRKIGANFWRIVFILFIPFIPSWIYLLSDRYSTGLQICAFIYSCFMTIAVIMGMTSGGKSNFWFGLFMLILVLVPMVIYVMKKLKAKSSKN